MGVTKMFLILFVCVLLRVIGMSPLKRMQRQPITYILAKNTPTKYNYIIYNKKLLAIIKALNK